VIGVLFEHPPRTVYSKFIGHSTLLDMNIRLEDHARPGKVCNTANFVVQRSTARRFPKILKTGGNPFNANLNH
jgi:hypothetical protein